LSIERVFPTSRESKSCQLVKNLCFYFRNRDSTGLNGNVSISNRDIPWDRQPPSRKKLVWNIDFIGFICDQRKKTSANRQKILKMYTSANTNVNQPCRPYLLIIGRRSSQNNWGEHPINVVDSPIFHVINQGPTVTIPDPPVMNGIILGDQATPKKSCLSPISDFNSAWSRVERCWEVLKTRFQVLIACNS
jgi:hypothetical protein